MPNTSKFDPIKERKECLVLVSKLKPLINGLMVKTKEDYVKADEYISTIRNNRALWKQRMAKILDPLKESVDSAKRALGSAKDLYDEIDGPMSDLESQVKDRMRAFKIEEARLIQEAQELKRKEEEKLLADIRAKEEAEAKAKTAGMQAKILEAKAKLQQALADKKQELPPSPIKTEGSKARTVKKYRIANFREFLQYVSTFHSSTDNRFADELLCLVEIDHGQMQAKFRLDKPEVGQWMPGVEVYEDINIAGR